MPFRSEKQRRFLWAKHPEIARRWAHEYKNKKHLPMYVNNEKSEKPEKEKAARVNTLPADSVYIQNAPAIEPITDMNTLTTKIADSVLKRVQLPQREKPTYAGQNDDIKPVVPNTACAKADGDEMTAKTLLSKLAVVLSPKILQEMEEQQALAEAREAQRVAQNVNLKQYPVNTNPTIPPPMGMTAPPAAPAPPQSQQVAQGSNQGTMGPVGGGSNPMFNPINSFGALSSTGNINGNAAFGSKNSPDSSKIAAAITKWAKASTPCSCGCGDTVATCKCGPDCKCRKPGGSCYKAEKNAGSPAWQRAAGKNEEGGLNAKGRASYNRATGGNLKAPVTESNPKGDRAKRQNSFCSRMCGMKKHETGSKTKKDPDSRINKALRKWNCKCSSAYEFGKAAAKRTGPQGPVERLAALAVRQYLNKIMPSKPTAQAPAPATGASKFTAPIIQ